MKKLLSLLMASLLFAATTMASAPVKPKLVKTIQLSAMDGSKTLFNVRDFFLNKKKIVHELREVAHHEPSAEIKVQQYRFDSFEIDVEAAFAAINEDIESLVLTQHQIHELIHEFRYDKCFLKAPSNLFLFKDPHGCLKIISISFSKESMRLDAHIMCLDGQRMPATNASVVGNIFVPKQP